MTTAKMRMPNFIMIGAAKSGTTSVCELLAQCPKIYFSPVKEPNFFTLENENLDFLEGTLHPAYLADFKMTLAEYGKLFQDFPETAIVGEASPSYLYSAKACDRIHHYVPDAKLIAILRNPVERAYSNFLHHIRDELETVDDFESALALEKERIAQNWWWGFYYTDAGMYYAQIKRYYDKFKSEQIRVYLYDDLKENPISLIQDIASFLGVDENFTPKIDSQHNVTGIPRNKLLYRFLTTKSLIKAPLKILPYEFRKKVSLQLSNRTLRKPEMAISIKEALIKTYYEDILKLQDLLQRDLSRWLK